MRSLRPAILTVAFTFLLLNRASAQFGPEQSMYVEGPETVDLVDLDQDGDKDLLVGDIISPTLLGLTNGGDQDSAHMVAQDILFPSYDTPVRSGPAPV